MEAQDCLLDHTQRKDYLALRASSIFILVWLIYFSLSRKPINSLMSSLSNFDVNIWWERIECLLHVLSSFNFWFHLFSHFRDFSPCDSPYSDIPIT